MMETAPSVFESNILVQKSMGTYDINADFDPVEKILTGQQKVTYTNNEKISFDSLYFHLYPNAFKTEKNAPFNKNEMKKAYPKGFETGYIHINTIKSDEKALKHTIMGLGDSVLKVDLSKELKPGEKIEIVFEFYVKIPPSCGRFGYGKDTINLGNWYPVIAVFDKKGWNLDPYYAIGDPFYSNTSNYRVSILAPKEYILASSGNLIKKEEINGKLRWTLEANNVRDFAMIMSGKFHVLTDEVNGVKIYAYSIGEEFGPLALETARDAIEIFGNLYGKYPYEQFSVAASDFFIGGMEYPNLVFIDKTLYTEDAKQMMEYVIAHEVGHQWWYGIVGNDEVNEPWLDEALTEYSTVLYYENKYGKETKDRVYKNMIAKYYYAYENSQPKKEMIVYRGIKEFQDSLEYQMLVYYKGAMFMENLRKELGDDVFFKAMRVYFDKYKYKNATTEDFVKVCEHISNKNMRENFKKWLKYTCE